jgi:hypothetical protein
MPLARAAPAPPLEPPAMRVETPGVAHGAVVRVVGCDAEGELVQVGLAEHHGAAFAEIFHDGGVEIRDVIGEDLRAEGGPDTGRAEQVLVGDGDTVQGSAVRPARSSSSAWPAAARAASAVTVRKALSAGFGLLDAIEAGLGQFEGGEAPARSAAPASRTVIRGSLGASSAAGFRGGRRLDRLLFPVDHRHHAASFAVERGQFFGLGVRQFHAAHGGGIFPIGHGLIMA